MENLTPQPSVLAPTAEDYKAMWEQERLAKSSRIDPELIKRQAIREVLKEEVKKQVKPNERLIDIFTQEIGR
jgi:hypothetical protein